MTYPANPAVPAARRSRRRLLGAAAAGAIAAAVFGAPAAHATYPGNPGVLVFGAVGAGQADLWSVNADGSNLKQLTATPAVRELCPAVSADGRHLASCRNVGGNFEIWTSDIGGGRDRQLTHLGGHATFPDWNPQGNRIAFSWAPTQDDLSNLYLVHARSGKVTPLLLEDGFAHEYPVFSPDGRTVLYVKQQFNDDGDAIYGQLWTVDVHSGQQRQLTDDDTIKDQTPDWSPDGSRIAYQATTDGDDDIWIMNADGTDQQNLTAAAGGSEFATAFSPDGEWIAFTGTGGPVADEQRYVQVMRTDGSDRHVVSGTPGLRQAAPAWQPTSHRTK
jgi:Tol biopolymer transport system component